MSSRNAIKKKSIDEFPTPIRKSLWTDEDKSKLLESLRKFGYMDIESIANEFPNKSKGAVRTMVNKYHSIARRTGVLKKSQLDDWLSSGYFYDTETIIPQALKFIALFENHPLPEKSAGCDFRALYNLLHRATMGQPCVDISRMTKETVFYILDKITQDVWPQHETEVCQYIESLEDDKERHVYRGQKNVTFNVKSNQL